MTVIRQGRSADDGVAVVNEVEGEIREFIRHGVTPRRKQQSEAVDQAGAGFGALVQRVAGSSIQEIDMLITELQNVRDYLQREGERVQREIADYTRMTQAAMTSIKAAENGIEQWRSVVTAAQTGQAEQA